MGGGASSRSAEPVGEYLSRKIAAEVQGSLDEYMVNNPDFPVRQCVHVLASAVVCMAEEDLC
jgi:hypothetical protein